ncbi:hypothetical protein [Nonomuraea zeae]|uniref:Uncharacterized protein n=1 Tax=Nonomuraea zeae TaxID=1642303 RepID=A0A5S4GIR7_9ACTN|nr:hypothetical protein [Nonomuraea zeae]TMR32394.1 hypothetical protein ETD85_23055 [Nonomuraea zeae]
MNYRQKGCGATGSRDTAQVGRTDLRGLRAAVFAVVCVYAALGMHTLAGGSGARLATVAAATVLTWAGAFVLARRRRSMGTLLTASFAAQYGMHQLFGWEATAFAGHHESRLSTGVGMLLAHVVVATLSAWWLERGESSLVTILVLLAASVRDLWARLTGRPSPPPWTPERLRLVTAVPPGVPAAQVLTWALCRRGPPARA